MAYDFNSRNVDMLGVQDAGDVALSSVAENNSTDFVSAVCWKKVSRIHARKSVS